MADLSSTLGPFLLGALFNSFLGGLTMIQAWNYYLGCSKDKRVYFALVTFLVTLDVLNSAFTWHAIYTICVTDWGDYAALGTLPWSLIVSPAMTSVVACLTQTFYLHRVWIVSSKNLYLCFLVSSLSLVQLGFGLALTVQNFHSTLTELHNWSYGVTVWLVTVSAADVILTVSLIFFLSRATSDNGILAPSLLVLKVLENFITNNGLTALSSLADMILFLKLGSTSSFHGMVQLTILKLYTNSLLVWLNSRDEMSSNLAKGSKSPRGPSSNQATGQRTSAHFRGDVSSADAEGGFQLFSGGRHRRWGNFSSAIGRSGWGKDIVRSRSHAERSFNPENSIALTEVPVALYKSPSGNYRVIDHTGSPSIETVSDKSMNANAIRHPYARNNLAGQGPNKARLGL